MAYGNPEFRTKIDDITINHSLMIISHLVSGLRAYKSACNDGKTLFYILPVIFMPLRGTICGSSLEPLLGGVHLNLC